MERIYRIDTTNYNALLFDFDGTLVNTEPIQHEAFARTLAEYSATYVSFDKHKHLYAGTGSRYIFTQEIERQNLNVDIEELLQKRNKIYLELVNEKEVPTIAGIKSLLKSADKLGFKLAIVSGGHRDNIIFVLNHSGIPDVFDAIVSIEDVDSPKPSPAGFLKAMRLCGVSADQSVSFEDGISGIIAAKEAKVGKRFAISQALDIMQVKKSDPDTILIKDFRELIIY